MSKNAVFELNSLPGFWTPENPAYCPWVLDFGPNSGGPKSGQGKLADLDALEVTLRYGQDHKVSFIRMTWSDLSESERPKLLNSLVGEWKFNQFVANVPQGNTSGFYFDSIRFSCDNNFIASVDFSKHPFIGGLFSQFGSPVIEGEVELIGEGRARFKTSSRVVVITEEIHSVSDDELVIYDPIQKYQAIFKRIK